MVFFSSNFSGFGALDRKECFDSTGESGSFGKGLEMSWVDEFGVSCSVRPAVDPVRCDFTETEVGVEGHNVGVEGHDVGDEEHDVGERRSD